MAYDGTSAPDMLAVYRDHAAGDADLAKALASFKTLNPEDREEFLFHMNIQISAGIQTIQAIMIAVGIIAPEQVETIKLDS